MTLKITLLASLLVASTLAHAQDLRLTEYGPRRQPRSGPNLESPSKVSLRAIANSAQSMVKTGKTSRAAAQQLVLQAGGLYWAGTTPNASPKTKQNAARQLELLGAMPWGSGEYNTLGLRAHGNVRQLVFKNREGETIGTSTSVPPKGRSTVTGTVIKTSGFNKTGFNDDLRYKTEVPASPTWTSGQRAILQFGEILGWGFPSR